MSARHFLDVDALSTGDLRTILDLARDMKRAGRNALPERVRIPMRPVLAMIFDKPSTRTRVSFDVAMRQLGGETVVLNRDDMQLGRGESIADTARVLSRYVDAIMLRTGPHQHLVELAENATIPVVNGLTNRSHPCQVMADILTIEERFGDVAGKTVAWIGDGNNVAVSWVHAAVRLGCRLRLACPEGLSPDPGLLEWAAREGGDVILTHDPEQAASGAQCLVTDVWVSMGDGGAEERAKLLKPFQINHRLLALADRDAIFLHCLPAHRGEEVTADVIDGPQSAVFDEAENRLHAQKAILAWCLESA